MNLTAERSWLHHFHPCRHHHYLCDDSHNLHHLHEQALSQFLAILVTLGFAIVGGVVTGVIMHQVKCFTIFYTKVKVFMPFYDILVKFDLYKVGKLDPVVVSELFNDERNIDGMMDK